MRTIKHIIPSQKVPMGGTLIDQPLPIKGLDMVDPFLLIHHHRMEYPGGEKQKDLGVPPHPHRGFSPVTFVFEGDINHRDSMGNDKKVRAGGIQWLFAGSGMIHSERPSDELSEKGGVMEIIQIWVNAPQKKKMEKPFYYPLQKEEIPSVFTSEKKSEIGIICGEVNKIKGPMPTMSELVLLRGELKSGDSFSFALPKSNNIVIYLLDGKMQINGENTVTKNLVVLGNDDENVNLNATENTRFILLAGEPINEHVSTYGPFVMTSQREIYTAIEDFQNGKMGQLQEEF